jgi:hypothetical protein
MGAIMAKIIVEHKDGRRVSVEEDDFDRVEANPFNQPQQVMEYDANRDLTIAYASPARPLDDHVSLKKEGFKPVMRVHGERHTKSCDDDCPGAGAEMPLEGE